MLILALNPQVNLERWKLPRSVGGSIVIHFINGDLKPLHEAGLKGPDNEYIHCTLLNEANWKMIADTGGHVSIAPAIETARTKYSRRLLPTRKISREDIS